MRSVLNLFTSSVRRQLLSSFGVVLVLFMVFAVVGFWQLQRLQQHAEEIGPATNQIQYDQEFAAGISRFEITLDNYLLTTTVQSREELRDILDNLSTLSQQIKDAGVANSPALMTQFEQRLAQLQTGTNQLLDTDLATLSSSELNELTVSLYAQASTTRNTHQLITQETLQLLDENSQQQQDSIAVLGTAFIVLGLVSLALVLVTPALLSRRIGAPLANMAQTAGQLAAGNLSLRVPELNRIDEVGRLSSAFNNMAAQLAEMVGSLEARVQARTRDLEVAAQVSEQVASILDVDQLLLQVSELVKDNFNLYHAHIYLKDDTGEELRLAAGAGEPGRTMKTHGHRIQASAERSLVARAARDNTPVIVDNVASEPGFLPNPMLPHTVSEAAFPLSVGDRVLGVLDVQSETAARFDRDLLSVLSTLAGQIAVTLDNARLFSSIERASRRERVLGTITQAMQGATNVDEVLQVAARELGRALRVPHTAVVLQLPREQMPTIDTDQPAADFQAVPERG
jgi:nitrate/nitrite-specific signal transduction histidine kinase